MEGSCRWQLAAAAAALALCARCALAAPGALPGYIPANGGSQFMVYVSHALGARGAGALRFGLRFENATPASADPAFRFCAPLRHRTLVDFQLARGSAPRMLFGERAAWDMGRGRLGPTESLDATWPRWRKLGP